MPRDDSMNLDLFRLGPDTAALVAEIQRDKYMQPNDGTWRGAHRRVAWALFAGDPDRAAALHDSLGDRVACPAGRVMAGAGSEKNVTWWNCFVAPLLQDSMRTDPSLPGRGIMDCLADVAYSMQMGGGVGTDFSPIRPEGALVKRVAAPASGPLSFMDMWDAMCRTIMSAGARRGAMMATLRCDHPDLMAFIRAKRAAGRLRMFNLSVLVTDAFMTAKEAGEDWELGHWEPPFDQSKLIDVHDRLDDSHPGGDVLRPWYVYARMPARQIWDELMRSTYQYAEPGVIFIDRVNRMNNLYYCEYLQCCNPCFTGNTKVWTAHGPRTFADLSASGDSTLVLTELEDGKLAYRKMVAPRMTQRSAEIIKITFKTWRGVGSNKRKSLTSVQCTPDHELYLVGGAKRRAKDLRPGDRIESAYRTRANQKGYIAIRATNGDNAMEHHIVAEYDHGRRPIWPQEHGHHSDEIKDNNIPGNVEIVNSSKHNSEHMLGDRNPMRRWFANADSEEQEQYRSNMSASQSGENNGMFGRKHSEETKRKIGDKTKERIADPAYYERWRQARNHTVVSIESINQREDVYCGTVPATGRFFVSLGDDHYEGVLVSNCGEQMLPPDNNCNLSHVNLSRCTFGEPFTDECFADISVISHATRLLVRASDRVIDLSPVPTEAQRAEGQAKRRIGLGITGLANMLMFLRQRYGSPQAVETVEAVMRIIRDASYRESIELAKERGPFPAFDRDKYIDGKFIQTLPDDIRQGIYEHGIRNALLNTVAPTGTVSIAQADNSSAGLEPVFLARYVRKVLQPDNSFRESTVEDFGFRVYANALFGGDFDAAMRVPIPDYMVTTADLTPEDHLVMQAAVQRNIDNSVSKTINCPTDISFENFVGIYDRANALGCKGCTTYREVPDSGRGAVLTAVPMEGGQSLGAGADGRLVPSSLALGNVSDGPSLRPRPEVLDGRTYRLRWASLPYPMFLTVNDEVTPDGRRVPYEVFVNSKAVDYAHWVSALTRMISAVMRKGGDLTFIPEELKAVWSARGGEFIDKRFVPSEVALIGLTLERHFREIGYIAADDPPEAATREEIGITGAHYAELGIGEECPACGALQVIKAEGCKKCLACQWSNCG